MTFLEDLRAGTDGLQFQVPDTFKVLHEVPDWVVLQDLEHKVDWRIGRPNQMLDLQPENDGLLEKDIRIFARGEFET